jgi:hypothetical protein
VEDQPEKHGLDGASGRSDLHSSPSRAGAATG